MIGDLADHFDDVTRIGDGAEGGALAATERATERRVVLKRVPSERAQAIRYAFGVLRRAGSPHLPAPRALLTAADGSVWMVTDWVPGCSVPVKRASRVADALAEARAVAHALAAIHGAGTHHGDVAPGNVVVTPTGGVVLVDLGQLGRKGMGTPGFLAPEVLAGGGGPAADRFSLGCLLCLRLWGQTPWRRPEALLRVHDGAAVRARLEQLGAASVDPPVRELVARLLDPDPLRRIADPDQLVTRLTRLHAAADAGLDLRRSAPWWPPARWPYHGPSLAPVVQRILEPHAPRLVAIAGPPGSGRGRVVEELIQSLQLEPDGPPARVCEPSRLAAVLGQSGPPWLEAWRTGATEGVVGVLAPPPWPSGLADADSTVSRAAVLQQVASEARAIVVVPVDPALGEALAQRGALVHQVRPWSCDQLAQVLHGVVDPADREHWARRLHTASGGWPAAAVRAAQACAAAQLDDPRDASAIDAAVAAAQTRAHAIDRGTARAVMLAVWSQTVDALPSHLHDGERPWATVQAAARQRLGPELVQLARDVVEGMAGSDQPLSVVLAVDADRPRVIEAHLRAGGDESQGVGRWLEAGGAARLDAQTVAGVMRRRLATGDVDGVLALAPHAPGVQGQLVQARALQRRGRLDEALACAEAAAGLDSPVCWQARGLRWRLWIDQGQGALALRTATEALPEAPRHGLGSATAHLWGAMAALVAGEHERAEAWLRTAVEAGHGVEGRPAAGIRARAQQLNGNLAQARGQLRQAQDHYAAAAASFEAAGEPVGGLMLRGSLAGLAVLAYDFAAGVEHGRAAVGGLLAQGQLSATLEAGLNLLQLLVRVGQGAQAQTLGRLLEELHGATATGLVAGRLARVRAELAAARLRPRPGRPVPRGAQATAESAFVDAAALLANAGAATEATEAWRHAAALARVQGQRGRATAHLAAATAQVGDDPDARVEVELEAALQDLATEQPVALERALARLAGLPRPEAARQRGRVDLAWSYDRTLVSALRRRLPSNHPARRRAAQRGLQTLDLVMKQTAPLDRNAVRGALLVDGGDPQPLRELLAELDEVPAAPAAPPAPANTAVAGTLEHTRFEQLLRIYRRLAREDRLEVLLQQVVDAMMDLTDAERGAVVVLPTAHTSRLEVTRELAEGSEGVRFSRSVIERVLGDGEPVMSVDAAADDRFDGSRSISHLNLRSVLAVPLQFRGERLGAAYVDHRLRRGNFDEQDLARMEEFAELAALAVAHARAVAELRAQAEAMATQKAELARLLEARQIEVLGLREEVRSAQGPAPRGYRGIIGGSEVMARIFKLIDRVADADVPVVIHGESGTGKELVARALHDAGTRRDGPFIAENCGAIPETLLESVLFGHAKGAFTGAATARAGLFEAADGGTIFLDEVGETSPAMQTKLLRVLQEGEVRRVGDNRSRSIDVRVIAASNRSLEAMVERGEFRRDLYYRINVVKIELPPLRERVDDIPALVEHFARRHDAQGGLRVSAAAMRRLAQHPWPGNVRELENEVQRWAALVEGEVGPDDLSMAPAAVSTSATLALGEHDDLQIRPRIERMERELIAQAMERTGGNQTKAAQLLGLSRYGLQKKLRRLAETSG